MLLSCTFLCITGEKGSRGRGREDRRGGGREGGEEEKGDRRADATSHANHAGTRGGEKERSDSPDSRYNVFQGTMSFLYLISKTLYIEVFKLYKIKETKPLL